MLAFTSLGCGSVLGQSREDAHAQADAVIAERRARDEAEQRRELALSLEDESRRKQRQDDAKSAAANEEKGRQDTHAARCAADRAQRVADTKRMLVEHLAWFDANRERFAYFKSHCTFVDTRGIKVTRERVKDGVILRSKSVGEAEELRCDAKPGRPKGIDDAWVDELSERVERTFSVPGSMTCNTADVEALGVSLNLDGDDRENMNKVLALPVVTPP